jgi:hypothetical protein
LDSRIAVPSKEKREGPLLSFDDPVANMSSTQRQQKPPKPQIPVDKEQLKKAFDVSHFDLNAVLRGIQLTLVGGKIYPRPDFLGILFGRVKS